MKEESSSSEDGSEKDVSDKVPSEVGDMDVEDEDLTKAKFDDDDELNELLEDDSKDERDFESCEDSPVCEPAPVIVQTSTVSKPLPPGWFGKGRRKKK